MARRGPLADRCRNPLIEAIERDLFDRDIADRDQDIQFVELGHVVTSLVDCFSRARARRVLARAILERTVPTGTPSPLAASS